MRSCSVDGFLTLVIITEIVVPLVTSPLFENALTTRKVSKPPIESSMVMLHEGELGEKVEQLVVNELSIIDSSELAPKL